MERSKKGQAALEFLLTYSWAILVVIVIIGALAYFGVLNPENFIPEMCTFAAGFACTDYVYDDAAENLTIRVTNGLGRGIELQEMNFTSESVTGGICTGTALPDDIMGNGDTRDIVFDTCAVSGSLNKLRGEVTITYLYPGGIAQNRTIRGDVFVNVQ
jgi:hypothetical protein